MTNKVGPKGQVVIPKEFRDELGIQPGDEVIFWLEGGDLHVKRVRPLKTLRGLLSGPSATNEIEEEHRREIEKDERRFKQFFRT